MSTYSPDYGSKDMWELAPKDITKAVCAINQKIRSLRGDVAPVNDPVINEIINSIQREGSLYYFGNNDISLDYVAQDAV